MENEYRRKKAILRKRTCFQKGLDAYAVFQNLFCEVDLSIASSHQRSRQDLFPDTVINRSVLKTNRNTSLAPTY